MIKCGKFKASESKSLMVAIALMPLYLLQTLPLDAGFTGVFPGNSWTVFTWRRDADVIILLLPGTSKIPLRDLILRFLCVSGISRKHILAWVAQIVSENDWIVRIANYASLL